MPTPKQFINRAIAMESFFEDEEPTYDEFMRYPPFDSLMDDEFSLQNMINAYREGKIVFHTKTGNIGNSGDKSPKCNFITKEYPNTVFEIIKTYNKNTYDELDPTSLDENTHEALMNVKLKIYTGSNRGSAGRTASKYRCENLTIEQESAFSSFIAKTLYEGTSKEQGDDGKQALMVTIYPKYHTLLTTPYLKIYEPFNTNLPESISKRLTELFERAKV